MAIGYLVISTIAGLIAFIGALALGIPFWFALLIYSGTGMLSVISLMTLQLLHDRFSDDTAKGMEPDGSGFADDPHTLKIVDIQSDAPDDGLLTTANILAVDDDPSLRELIPMLTAESELGNVTTASSGHQALEIIESAPTAFNCFLLDISMPGMDGIELCNAIRKLPAHENTPIIMLTAMRDVEYLSLAFKAGATDYVTKPFDIVEFVERVRAANGGPDLRKRTVGALRETNALPMSPIARTGG